MVDIYDTCKCGSGKKYKWCCLQKDREEKKAVNVHDDKQFEMEFEGHLQAKHLDKVLAIINDLDAAGELASPDAITLLLDRLIYHDLGGQVIAIMQKLLPRMSTDNEFVGWAKEDFEDGLVTMMILKTLGEKPRGAMDQLLEQIDEVGYELDDAFIPTIAESLDHWHEHEWKLAEFALDAIDLKSEDIPEKLSERLFKLGYDFVGFAAQMDHASHIRANFAAVEIISYLLDRAYGVLDDESSTTVAPPTGGQFFCPDALTLKRYVDSKVFSLSTPSFHAAAMIMDLVPTWIQFLVDRKLLGEKRADTALNSLKPVATDIYQSCTGVVADAGLAAGRSRWHL